MPGIDRRAICGRLLLICSMPKNVVELAGVGRGSQIEFADRVADAVPGISRAIGIASVRGFGHPDADEMHRDGSCAEPYGFRVTGARHHRPLRKCLPDSACGRADGILSTPILHSVMGRIRLAPCDAYAVNGLNLSQINHDPLGMQSIAFSGEMLSEIRIALPKSMQVAVRETRVPGVFSAIVACKTATRQSVAIGITQAFRRIGRTREITFARGITPASIRIPVPCLDCEFGILPKRHRLPS